MKEVRLTKAVVLQGLVGRQEGPEGGLWGTESSLSLQVRDYIGVCIHQDRSLYA